MRWLNHGDWAVAQRAERGAKQSHLSHTGLLHQQVDQRADGPAAARKLF